MKRLVAMGFGLSVVFSGCANSDAVKNTAPSSATTNVLPVARVAVLRAELEAMFETDQKVRRKLVSAKGDERAQILGEMNALDKANQARLSEIYSEAGWPTISAFGNKAAEAAFLIVQHSNPAIMKQYYGSIRAAAEKGEMRKSSFALLEDRIRMNDGRPQLYGSQVTRDESGKQVFWKIEDEANVDVRRAQMELAPLADYAKYFKDLDYVPFAQRSRAKEKVEGEAKPK